MEEPAYTLGLDLGTAGARALIVDVESGREAGAGSCPYAHGDDGVIGDPTDPAVARQHPGDYAPAIEAALRTAVAAASAADPLFSAQQIVGIGIDATASTPLPVDGALVPLALSERFSDDLDAHAWLWKDHTAHREAEEITALAARERPQSLERCGGSYSSEWYFSKLLRCLRVAPHVLEAAEGFVELGDWVAGLLGGVSSPRDLSRGICAASHKAMYDPAAGGLPGLVFLARLDKGLGEWFEKKGFERAHTSDTPAGFLSPFWAERLGLRSGIPVAVACIDAHAGAVGAGIAPGVLVKVLGTSGCDLLVHPASEPVPVVPGTCGVALGSILPGSYGLEAGQAAVGDIFGWFVREFGKPAGHSHDALTAEAARLRPGQSGLLALDWHNGNRSLLADPLLTGTMVGLTLKTRPAEVYRALIEATAFGARAIMDRFEECRVPVREVVVSGGIARKNPFLLATYASVTGRSFRLARSSETCALGAAIFGAAAASSSSPTARGRTTVEAAQKAMTRPGDVVHEPDPAAQKVYDQLYTLYRALHDAFGRKNTTLDLHGVMKKLIDIREREGTRANRPT